MLWLAFGSDKVCRPHDNVLYETKEMNSDRAEPGVKFTIERQSSLNKEGRNVIDKLNHRRPEYFANRRQMMQRAQSPQNDSRAVKTNFFGPQSPI